MSAKQMTIELNSDPTNIGKVESFVKTAGNQFGIKPEQFGDILISVTEAVNNAMIHGNCRDRRKKVRICLFKQNNRLAFKVSDQGCGFDHKKLPDPTKPENLMTIGGRGVFLMQQLSDRIRFMDNGRTVEMQFKLR